MSNALLTMHREVASRWALLTDDLRKLAGNQMVMRDLMGSPRNIPGFWASSLWEMMTQIAEKLTSISAREMESHFEPRLDKLDALSARSQEHARRFVEINNSGLTASISELRSQVTEQQDQLHETLIGSSG